MKKFKTPFFILIVFLGFLSLPLYSQNIAQPERYNVINRLNLFADIPVYDYNAGSYKYDAILVVMRTVENRKKNEAEEYDNLSYKCYAEARFFKPDRKTVIPVDSVVVNGLKLNDMNFGTAKYYLTSDKYLSNVPSLSPNIKWKVYGGADAVSFGSDTTASILKFPDFYFIESYSPDARIGQNIDWPMTISKWKTDAGFTLPKPDLLRGWILSLSNAPSAPLANFQPMIKSDNVTETSYNGIIESRYNIFDSRSVLPGQGCAVVRTYKLYPIQVTDSRTGEKFDWLFVMGVESEVPVNFQ